MSRICVKNLSKSTTEKTLRETFSRKGEVTDVRLMKTSTGKSRQFAFIGFRNDQDATEALKYFNNTYVDTYKVAVEVAKKLEDASLGDARSKYTKKKLEKLRKEQERSEKELNAAAAAKSGEQNAKKSADARNNGVKDKDLEEFFQVSKSRGSKNKWGNDEAQRMEVAGGDENGGGDDGDDDEIKDGDLQYGSDGDASSDNDEDYEDISKSNIISSNKKVDKNNKVVSDMDFLRSKIKSKATDNSSDEDDDSDDDDDDDDDEEDDHDDIGSDNDRNSSRMTEKKISKTASKISSKNNTDKSPSNKGESDPNNMKTEDNQNSEEASSKPAAGGGAGVAAEEIDESGRLFVRNLSFTCEETELRVLFEPFGTITAIHIPLGKEVKKSSGFAFVEFMLPECAKRAKDALDGTPFQGRLLHILFAKDEPEYVSYSASTGLDSNGRKLSSFQLKKEEERKKMIHRKDGLNASFVRSDAVIDALADRYGIRRVDILDTSLSSSEVVLRQALAEAQIIEENRNYFIAKNINLNVLESFHNKDANASYKRSANTLLIKNLPFDMVPDELEQMFAKYGAIRSFLVPPSRTICLIDFIEASECRKAFKTLNYRNYKKMPLYIEYAPLGTINFTPENGMNSNSNGAGTSSNSSTNKSHSNNDNKMEQFLSQLNSTNDSNSNNNKDAKNDSTETAKQSQSNSSIGSTSNNSNSNSSNNNNSSNSSNNIFSSDYIDDDGDDFSTLFIKNLNFSTTEAILVEFITKKLKLLGLRSVSIQLKKNPNTNSMVSMGFGFAEFRSRDYALKAQKALHSATLESHTLEVKPSDKRISASPHSSSGGASKSKNNANGNKNTKLLVKNVPFQATILELKALFSSFGSVRKVRIPKTMSANHRGFAFVEFNTHYEAENAMKALKQTHLYGRHLVIEWAQLDDADADDNNNAAAAGSGSKGDVNQLRKRAKFDANVISHNQSKKKRVESSDPTNMDSFGSKKSNNDFDD